MSLPRRTFLQGCSALAVLAGARLNRLALAAPNPGTDTLVLVSLRGGWDALSAIVPRDGEDRARYIAARPTLRVDDSLDLDGRFGLHPALQSLMPLWRAGQLGLVPAAGLQQGLRSHFEAMASMDAGEAVRRSGWLGRYLAGLTGSTGFPAVAIGLPNLALQGYPRTLTLDSLTDLNFSLPREDLLLQMYTGDTGLQEAGRQALTALQAARKLARHPYRPRREYPDSEFSRRLREAARMIKCPELGVRALTLELEGWDTHTEQNDVFPQLLEDLAEGLLAFVEDLQGHPLTIVVLSEFGRRLAENDGGGTDHGHGSAILVLGEKVRGGIHGQWPGLAKEQLYDLEDLAVTTDYRTVLSEILTQRMGCGDLESVFPHCPEQRPVGLFGGS